MNGQTTLVHALLALLGVALASLALTGCGVAAGDVVGSTNGDATTEDPYDPEPNLDLGPRTDSAGNEIPDDAHPLGGKIAALTSFPELFLAGATFAADDSHGYHLIDNPTQLGHYPARPQELLHKSMDDTWTDDDRSHRVGSAGDVDGNGFEETIVLHSRGEMRPGLRVEWSTELLLFGDIQASYGHRVVGALPLSAALDVDAADLDEDGRDELVVIDHLRSGNAHEQTNRIVVLDDQQANFALLSTIDSQVSFADLEVADLDSDGQPEIAVVGTEEVNGRWELRLWVFDRQENGDYTSKVTKACSSDHGYYWSLPQDSLRIAVGDFDGDLRHEIAVMTTYVAEFFEDHRSDFAWQRPLNDMHYQPSPLLMGSDTLLAAIDLDGDRRDELIVDRVILKIVSDSGGMKAANHHTQIGLLTDMSWVTGKSLFVVGNFDQDAEGREELFALVHRDKYGPQTYLHYVYDDDGYIRSDAWLLEDPGDNPILVAPNADGDSIIVEYQAHELQFTNPNVLAVIAAPPYWAQGDIQVTENTGTSFGQQVGTSTEEEWTAGVSSYFSIGFEVDVPLLQTEVSASVTAGGEYKKTWGITTEYSTGWSAQANSNEDKVVLHVVPFDVYEYRIISSPYADTVGTVIHLNLPRSPIVYQVTMDYYNAHNATKPDIDGSVLGHTIGRPNTYPTLNYPPLQGDPSERDAEFIYLLSDEKGVGQGTSFMVADAQVAKSEHHGRSGERSVTISGETKALGVTAGNDTTFSESYEWKITTTNSTLITGLVGDISDWGDTIRTLVLGSGTRRPTCRRDASSPRSS